MKSNLLVRTATVLMVAAATALVIFGGVATTNAALKIVGLQPASSTPSIQTCPTTGCTATHCHAMDGTDPYAQSGQGSDSRGSSVQGRGYPSPTPSAPNVGTGSGGRTLQTCPATGCTATYCHGAENRGRAGRGSAGPNGAQPY